MPLLCTEMIRVFISLGVAFVANVDSLTGNNDSAGILIDDYCSCQHNGKMYDIKSLEQIGGPRFSAPSNKYPGYSYAYNPCVSFKKGAAGKGCQKDVALCWWAESDPNSYTTIGTQSSVQCGLDNSGVPHLVYKSHELGGRKSIVKLKCDPSKKKIDDATFEVLDDDTWVFQVTHDCACADACPAHPLRSSSGKRGVTMVIPVVAVASGVLLFVPVFLLFRWWRKKQTEAEVRRRLIEEHNVFDQPEINNRPNELLLPADHVRNLENWNRAQSVPVGSQSCCDITVDPKDDVNLKYPYQKDLAKTA